jgi:hypothetical protein
VVRGGTEFWRLGSEPQVACRSLTSLRKAAVCLATYPTTYPTAKEALRWAVAGVGIVTQQECHAPIHPP